MICKICGMRDPQNIADAMVLGPDYIGMVFYPLSPRYAGKVDPHSLEGLKSVPRIGVFVNESLSMIEETSRRFALRGIQLHGNETPEICRILRKKGFLVIKAFAIEVAEDFIPCKVFEGCCDLFLFDTKCPGYGGSGGCFDWSLLKGYHGETPFLLSGGIWEGAAEAILHLDHPRFAGVDLNSRFESSPGIKEIARLASFLEQIKKNDHDTH